MTTTKFELAARSYEVKRGLEEMMRFHWKQHLSSVRRADRAMHLSRYKEYCEVLETLFSQEECKEIISDIEWEEI